MRSIFASCIRKALAGNFLIDPLRDVEGRVVDGVPLLDSSEGLRMDVEEDAQSNGVGHTGAVLPDNVRLDLVLEGVLALGHQDVEDVEGFLRCLVGGGRA